MGQPEVRTFIKGLHGQKQNLANAQVIFTKLKALSADDRLFCIAVMFSSLGDKFHIFESLPELKDD